VRSGGPAASSVSGGRAEAAGHHDEHGREDEKRSLRSHVQTLPASTSTSIVDEATICEPFVSSHEREWMLSFLDEVD
jgi:hypothetical protein